MVALGYSQIPGIDYTDNFAPVAHDVSFRIALARMMVEKLDSLVMDVETENSEEEKHENGEEENKLESKNPDDDERKVDPGTGRNTEEPQGTPLLQSYVSNSFTTGIISDWVMSTIEDNLATPRV